MSSDCVSSCPDSQFEKGRKKLGVKIMMIAIVPTMNPARRNRFKVSLAILAAAEIAIMIALITIPKIDDRKAIPNIGLRRANGINLKCLSHAAVAEPSTATINWKLEGMKNSSELLVFRIFWIFIVVFLLSDLGRTSEFAARASTGNRKPCKFPCSNYLFQICSAKKSFWIGWPPRKQKSSFFPIYRSSLMSHYRKSKPCKYWFTEVAKSYL